MWFQVFYPHKYVEDIYELDLYQLKQKGIRGIIADLDNTLVPWNERTVYPRLLKWLEKVKHDFRLCIVSNNSQDRGAELAQYLDVPAIWNAVKPRRRAFRQAIKTMGLKPSEVAVVGDQILTDILGGNRLGLYTILVRPIDQREFIGTRAVRQLEKLILRHMKKRRYLC